MADIPKLELLKRLGYAAPLDELLLALVDAGLTQARKQRINTDKRDAVVQALAQRFLLICARGDCQHAAQALLAGRPGMGSALPVDRRDCVVCGGSGVSQAVRAMVEALRHAQRLRLCVVGGSPTSHNRLVEEVGEGLELRLVDGTRARTLQQARTDVAWAQLTVIWGATLLDHRVSGMYKGQGCLLINGRGIEELATAVVEHLKRAQRPLPTKP